MDFNFQYPKRLKIAQIGAGEHSIRHILPALQYAPFELVALADHNTERGLAVARQFGAKRFYPNHKALLAKEEDLDAVLIVVGPDENGRPQYPELAAEALSVGLHVWIDAPPCLSASEVPTFTNACIKRHKYLAVGFRRRFVPAYQKAIELVNEGLLGKVNSYAMSYTLPMPAAWQRRNDRDMAAFLPFVSVLALLNNLFGEVEGLSYARHEMTGAAAMQIVHKSGVLGSVHLAPHKPVSAPRERLEIDGGGAVLIVEDGARVRFYRRESPNEEDEPERRANYLAGSLNYAPIVWEPRFEALEFAPQSVVLSGYLGSLRSFGEALLAGEPPKHGTLVEVLHVMTVFDAIRKGKEREWISLVKE